MASAAALIQFLAAGLTDPDTGAVYSGALVGYYVPGTATPKAVWTNRGKTTPGVGGETTSTLNSNGQYIAFGDGIYDIKVFDPEDTGMTTARMTFPSVNIADALVSATLTDPDFLDGSDPTKIASWDMSNITTATTRTFTLPDASVDIVGDDNTQAISNKTITSSTFSGVVTATAGSTMTGVLTGGIVETGSSADTMYFKVLDIGDWNMNVSVAGSATATVAHGLTFAKIRHVSAMIRDDTDTGYWVASAQTVTDVDLAILTIDGTNVELETRVGGGFDSTVFDATSFNRGWITIWYTA